MRYVSTNVGTIPIEDYGEIMAVQNGFNSYEELRKQGYRLGDDYDTQDDTPHERKGETMDLEIRPATKAERMYTYSQSQQISMQTGCIGHLRADMDTNGEGFFSSWDDFRKDLKTQEFKDEFDSVLNAMRENGGLLSNRTALSKYCYSTPASDFGDGREFGVRVDTDVYSYLMRLNPHKGEYNLYCYCYRKDWLDDHLKQAERGIRFIDPNYNEKFRLQDGGTIRVQCTDGTRFDEPCRYIDNYHLEVGRNLYHICEFAERMEQCGNTVKPVEGLMVPNEKAPDRGDAR